MTPVNPDPTRTEPRLTSLSHGGGCGCKIAPGVLSEILRGTSGLPIPPELMVGIETADDAAVYRLNAEQALIAKQTATALVDRLERAGLVERVPDPGDGRVRIVRLTARAEELRPLAEATEAAVYAEWTAHLGPERMAHLREALTMLREITDPFQG